MLAPQLRLRTEVSAADSSRRTLQALSPKPLRPLSWEDLSLAKPPSYQNDVPGLLASPRSATVSEVLSSTVDIPVAAPLSLLDKVGELSTQPTERSAAAVVQSLSLADIPAVPSFNPRGTTRGITISTWRFVH